jgi:tetratricopeptide (TPR) repeat protein
VQLVQRAGILGLGKIDPYFTALYLIQLHARDRDFALATTLIDTTLAQIPQTPISRDRALFQNLKGILTLFEGDTDVAAGWFLKAADADPNNAVTWLNAAFAEVQLKRYREAVGYAQRVTTMQPAPNPIILATAYMTWGAALLGLKDTNGADLMLAKSIEVNPTTSAGFELWADVKRRKANPEAAQRLHLRALENADMFENFSEVAALWFQLAWRDDQPLSRNQFTNPTMLQTNHR